MTETWSPPKVTNILLSKTAIKWVSHLMFLSQGKAYRVLMSHNKGYGE